VVDSSHEICDLAWLAEAAHTPHSMLVVDDVPCKVKLNHVLAVQGVEAPRREIIAHDHGQLIGLEQVQRCCPHLRCHLLVVRERQILNVLRAQELTHFFNSGFAFTEDNRWLIWVEHLQKSLQFVLCINIRNGLNVQVIGLLVQVIIPDDLDVGEPLKNQLFDITRHRARSEDKLSERVLRRKSAPLCRKYLQHLNDLLIDFISPE